MSNLLETNMWLVAAALEMQGVLFGDLKGGLSQESDAMRRYAITIENRCNAYYRPVLQKLLSVLYIMYEIDEIPDFDFNSLVADEVNVDRMGAIGNYANMLNGLASNGIISKYQAAVSIRNFVNNNAIAIDFSQEHLDLLKFEADEEILQAYKNAGKEKPTAERSAPFVPRTFEEPTEVPETVDTEETNETEQGE